MDLTALLGKQHRLCYSLL
uniref:Uncharacterized protein n=1 Tax=Anguilla anguilla TaxID=7936 RepID=A0A0E9UD43_ANGAN